MKGDYWKTEIVKKLPWSATFLVASFCFFKFTTNQIAGWVCLVIAIVALFLVIRFEYYEKIIDRQEQQIKDYSKQAIGAHKEVAKTLSDMNTANAALLGGYKKPTDSQTEAI